MTSDPAINSALLQVSAVAVGGAITVTHPVPPAAGLPGSGSIWGGGKWRVRGRGGGAAGGGCGGRGMEGGGTRRPPAPPLPSAGRRCRAGSVAQPQDRDAECEVGRILHGRGPSISCRSSASDGQVS